MTGNPKFDLTTRSLYLCTPLRDDLAVFVTEALKGGVDVIQLREKNRDART
ncbi:MAG: thiamine phosphate synthase, partial [Acidimicrobiaceae bacterium]|nr:thiamine phosphate synthase [Acidimicrobiaceae bacterium]